MELDDWKDPRNEISLRAWEIDPWNLDVVRSEIANLVRSKCALDEGYYSDTRMSASVCSLDSDIEDGSWIRLGIEVPQTGYSEELFCGPVSAIATLELDDCSSVMSWDCQSAIWAISEDKMASHWTIGKNAKASTAISKICSTVGKEYVTNGFHDYSFGETVTYEVDDSFSSILFDVCDRSTNRMDVDGHGRLTFSKYLSPASRSADWELDERDPRSLIIDVGEEEDSPGDAYGRVVVVHTEGDNEVIGSAEVSSTHRASSSKRGYMRTKVYTESDLSPATSAQASSKAREYLADVSSTAKELTMNVMWFPVHAGDMLKLTRLDGTSGLWLVQAVSCDFESWKKKLTLKEA